MTKEEERELREQLARLQQDHRDLDAAIARRLCQRPLMTGG